MKKANIILLTIMGAFLLFAIIYGYLNRNPPDTTGWKKTTGQIIHTSAVRIKNRKYLYEVDGFSYYGMTGDGFVGNVNGDRYVVLYNPENFNESYLLAHSPIFLPGEHFSFTVGEIDNYAPVTTNGGNKNAYPGYEYIVDGNKYWRAQKIQVPVDSPVNFERGMKFRVQYWVQNPQRSILLYGESVD